MDDMLETMYKAPGIGLAAVQIGILKRVVVIDVSRDENKNPIYLVNPVILERSKQHQFMKKVAYLYLSNMPRLKGQIVV